jgi:hypothetical protein
MSSMDPVQQTYAMLNQREQDRFDNPYKRSLRFRASETDACSRMVWFDLSNYKPDGPGEGRMSLYGIDGDVAHDVLRILMRDAGVKLKGLNFKDDGTVEETVNVRKEITHNGMTFMIACRADGVVELDGVDHALEIKSVSGFAYDWMRKVYMGEHTKNMKEQYGPGGAASIIKYLKAKQLKYFTQMHMTAYLAGLDACYLIIKDRSSCQFGFDEDGSALRFDIDMDLVNGALDKFAMIARQVTKGDPPMRPHVQSSKECGWCKFKERCWNFDK